MKMKRLPMLKKGNLEGMLETEGLHLLTALSSKGSKTDSAEKTEKMEKSETGNVGCEF